MRNKIIFIIIFLIIIALWARFISTKGLIVKEYSIVNDKIPKSFDGIKIVQFSDIHYGSTIFSKELENMVNKINLYKPDIVIFTGDLVEDDYKITDSEKENIVKILSKIDAVIGKYYIQGNHDTKFKSFNNVMDDSGFIYLNNETIKIYNKDKTPILLSGTTSILHSNPNYDEILSEDNEYYNIVAIHEPDALKTIRKYDVDLMLSGHSHGGQIRIPFIGAILTTNACRLYYDEHYTVDETELYVSSGLGTSGLKMRLFNKPSINLFRLNSK